MIIYSKIIGNKSTVYDSDNLNELASWKINETGFQMT